MTTPALRSERVAFNRKCADAMTTATTLPDFNDILAAAARIAPHAHHTPVLRSRALDELAGCELHFKAEHLQRAGAFKFRGACNAVWSLSAEDAARGVVTHSSGNHGAALALAARTRGIPCHVVVPENADENLIYQITKTMFEKKDELVKVHKDAAFLSMDNQLTGASPIPFHPGALRYFKEKGLKVN